ncbi:hypothetical protein E4T56_gene2187 [Termitomyces sp. T112]|nr:hypothetical protein E4T56_gene2187 [Termitomyces sp. T112]
MESTVARKEMESRIQELEEVQIQAANAIEQACTSAEAASRSETAFESVLNHNTEVISDLQEQVECLEAQTASNNSHHVSNMATDPSQVLQASNLDPSVQRPSILDTLSDRAHNRLPADSQLTRIHVTKEVTQDRHSQRRVSFELASIEETISPLLWISQLYSSMTPQTPHLRLPTLQPSSPAFPVPASRALHSSPLHQPLTPVLAPHQDSIPDSNSSSASAARNHQRPSGDNYLCSPSALNQASNHVLSPTPSHRSMPGFADNVYSMLTDLTGAVSLLREEWSETQNSFSAMNIPAVSVSRGYPVIPLTRLFPTDASKNDPTLI